MKTKLTPQAVGLDNSQDLAFVVLCASNMASVEAYAQVYPTTDNRASIMAMASRKRKSFAESIKRAAALIRR